MKRYIYSLLTILFCFTAANVYAQSGLFGGVSSSDSNGIFSGTRITGFVVGSLVYNSSIQMVPEFAGGAPALSEAGQTQFRFDKLGMGISKSFSSWLSASGAFEVDRHADRHAHGFDPAFGCPDNGPCIERFGAQEGE